MKLGIVLGSLTIGGLEKVTVILANALSQNYDIDLIVLGKNYGYYQLNDNVKLIQADIKYNLFEKTVLKILRRSIVLRKLAFYKEIQYLSELFINTQYDIVIGSDGYNSMLINEIINIRKEQNYFKMISWMHNDYNTYFEKYFKCYKTDLAKTLEKSSYVVTLTNHDKLDYMQHNLKTCCIYNPLTLDRVKLTKLNNREIIFVARLVREQKGLDYLIEIAKRIKNTGWVIRVIGSGKDEIWFKDEISRYHLNEVIVLQGEVSTNIEEFYANASLFISTSRWEGFGLVLTEAMACGLPIISFDNSGPHEILEGGEYGILIPKYNIDLFVEAILNFINRPKLLSEYSQKSLQRITRFSIENIMRSWEEIIE